MWQSKFMKTRWMMVLVALALGTIGMGTNAGFAFGQQKTAELSTGYDVNREVTLVGTVVSFSASSAIPPLGPHVTLQTSAGMVDVHLGDARLLETNHLNIQSGDTLRIIGEDVAVGSGRQFVARIVQKGTHAVVLRSSKGIPLMPVTPKNTDKSKEQEGVR
jgi:hypothetical protein